MLFGEQSAASGKLNTKQIKQHRGQGASLRYIDYVHNIHNSTSV